MPLKTPIDTNKIISKYINNTTLRQLSKMYHLSINTIKRILISNNIPIRKKTLYHFKFKYIDEFSYFTRNEKQQLHIYEIKFNDKWTIISDVSEFNIYKSYLTHTCDYHLVYDNNHVITELKYECQGCHNILCTTWKKFLKQHINHHNMLCQKCTMKLPNIREKISISTQKAMNLQRTIDNHNKGIQKFKDRIINNKDYQNKLLLNRQAICRQRKSKIQLAIEQYIRDNYDLSIEDEYIINLYNENEKLKYLLIDIAIPDKKIAIEILGEYIHAKFLQEYLNIKYHKTFNKVQERIFINDKLRHEYLCKNNWDILYIPSMSDYKLPINDFLKGRMVNE